MDILISAPLSFHSLHNENLRALYKLHCTSEGPYVYLSEAPYEGQGLEYGHGRKNCPNAIPACRRSQLNVVLCSASDPAM